MIALAWMLAMGVWVLVGVKVGRRICDQRRRIAEVERIREFANLVARDCLAGAHTSEAIRLAADAMELPALAAATFTHELGGGIPLGDNDAPDQQHFLALWAASSRHGLSLGVLADRHVIDIDAQLERHRTTSSAMAGARLTVLVLLGLPFGAVALGQTMGLGTAGFYVSSILGALLLLLGSILAAGGVLWTEHLSATVLGGVGRRAGPESSLDSPLDAARILDIVAAALRSGAPLAHAWAISTSCLQDTQQEVNIIPHLLALGAGARAWEGIQSHPYFGPIARLAAQHTRSGAMLAESMTQHAAHLRSLAAAEATAGAEKMLVILAAPLTLCFLPAFVLTGLVPLAISLAGV